MASFTAVKKIEAVIVLTGFGSFPGVPENPTQQIIQDLMTSFPQYQSQQEGQPDIPIIYHVLEVSVDYCREFVGKTFTKDNLSTFFPTTESTEDVERHVYCIHLGVDSNAKTMKLEQCAYNNMTFRVPDFRGYQPVDQQCILEGTAWDEAKTTAWDVEDLLQPLQAMCCNGYDVKVSTDPGRYLCNFIYYNTLTLNPTTLLEKMKIYSLFVHVPPFEVIDKDFQIQLVKTLVSQMVKQASH